MIQIAGESLRAEDGVYEIRIVEELREVAYLDEIRLIAVDRPAAIDVFTNDKFKGPPFPEFRLYGVGAPFVVRELQRILHEVRHLAPPARRAAVNRQLDLLQQSVLPGALREFRQAAELQPRAGRRRGGRDAPGRPRRGPRHRRPAGGGQNAGKGHLDRRRPG